MKHYNSIDLLKFLMSFFVIAIHTAYDQVLLMRLICPWVVPMFFVISGFLLQRRISMQRPVEVCGKRVENLLGGVINSYIIKLVKLYILWTLLYLPLTFYGSCVVESNSLLRAFALFCRNVIFTGENHMSWPLWYLLALIWASTIFHSFTLLLYSAVCNPDKVGRQKAVSMVQTDEYVDLFLSHVFCCHFSISVSGSICRSAAICIGICVDILFQLYCHTAYGSSRIQFSEKTCWIINVPVSKLQISMI